MKMKCISIQGARNITEGKTYNAQKASHSDYWKLKNDNGEMKCYSKSYFEPINK